MHKGAQSWFTGLSRFCLILNLLLYYIYHDELDVIETSLRHLKCLNQLETSVRYRTVGRVMCESWLQTLSDFSSFYTTDWVLLPSPKYWQLVVKWTCSPGMTAISQQSDPWVIWSLLYDVSKEKTKWTSVSLQNLVPSCFLIFSSFIFCTFFF